MKRAKYLLVAKMPNHENEIIHAGIQERITKVTNLFHAPASSIGPHITVCQAGLLNFGSIKDMISHIAYWAYRIERLPVTLAGWNYFKYDTGSRTLYRIVDANGLVHGCLAQLRDKALKHIRPTGIVHRHMHLHQTLGSIKCSDAHFEKIKQGITWAVMENYSPMEFPIEKFVLYQKKNEHSDWEQLHVFSLRN